MAKTREINYSMKFTADTTQVQQALQRLNTNLAQLSNAKINNSSTKNLKEMTESAQKLQGHLRNAFDATGNVNLAKFNQSLKASGDSIKTLSNQLIAGGKSGQQAFVDLASVISGAQRPVSKMNGLVGELWYTFKNTVKWSIASSAMQRLTGAISNAVSYAKNLNTALNNIKIVTGQSADEMKRFGEYATETAKALGTSTLGVARSAWTFYQQGDTDAVAKRKTEIATKAANISPNTDADQMATYLTAVWNGYQASEKELERYVDVLTEVGHTTATSLEEMATGMQKVASVAHTVGVDFNQLTSIISTVSSVTREAPETTGTSFKTIFARMEDLKLGKEDEDGLTLGPVSQTLADVGIQIMDTEGRVRDLGAVIEEMGEKWKTWDRGTQVAVAEQVAG